MAKPCLSAYISKARAIGVIAQEVEQVIPEVIATSEYGIKSVSYDSIVGLLIEAIKEQQVEINKLKNKIFGDNKWQFMQI